MKREMRMMMADFYLALMVMGVRTNFWRRKMVFFFVLWFLPSFESA